MRYSNSIHFNEDIYQEIESAMAGGNSIESITSTLEARLATEASRTRPEIEEIQRIQQQLAHVALVGSDAAELVSVR